jgi:hypothetical protein
MEKEKKALIPMERTAKQLLNFRRIAPISGVIAAPIIGMIQQSHAAHGSTARPPEILSAYFERNT